MNVKYGIIQHGMWTIFQSGFRKQLSLLHIADERAKKDIMRTAYQKYREIIHMIDPFGKDDVLLVNILSASAFAAIYLSLPAEYRLTPVENAAAFPETEECELFVNGKYTMKELSGFYESSMNENFVMRWYLKRSCFSKRYWQEQKGQAEKSQKSTNPYSWKYSFHPDKSGQHFDALFSHCGIWYLMQKLGIPEITPAMCRYDYGMTKYSDAIFTRKGTLAGGAKLCDCHYDKKQK